MAAGFTPPLLLIGWCCFRGREVAGRPVVIRAAAGSTTDTRLSMSGSTTEKQTYIHPLTLSIRYLHQNETQKQKEKKKSSLISVAKQ